MGLKENIGDLNRLITGGETIKAMDTYYSNDIEMQENEDAPRRGKSVCMEVEKENLQKVKEVKSTLLNQAIDEEKNVVFSEWQFLISYKDNSKAMLKEVSVQYWLNGQIAKEKFYFKFIHKVNEP